MTTIHIVIRVNVTTSMSRRRDIFFYMYIRHT